MRSGGRKAAQAGPAKSLKERTLAAAPSGAWLVRFLVNTVGLPPRLAGLLEAKPCCTHGSSCYRSVLFAAGCVAVVGSWCSGGGWATGPPTFASYLAGTPLSSSLPGGLAPNALGSTRDTHLADLRNGMVENEVAPGLPAGRTPYRVLMLQGGCSSEVCWGWVGGAVTAAV